MVRCSGLLLRRCGYGWLASSIRCWRCIRASWSRCHIRSRPSTGTCCRGHRCGSCWLMTRAPGRPSWRGSFDRWCHQWPLPIASGIRPSVPLLLVGGQADKLREKLSVAELFRRARGGPEGGHGSRDGGPVGAVWPPVRRVLVNGAAGAATARRGGGGSRGWTCRTAAASR